MATTPSRLLPILLLACLAQVPLPAGRGSACQDAPPPAPPAPGGTDPKGDPKGKDAPPPPAKAAPPATIEQAYRRYCMLRDTPLGGPGSYTRRMERVRTLAEQALALNAEKAAAGEDLYRLAELCMEAERFADAVSFAGRYVDGAGKDPLPSLGSAHAVRVRALARQGKIPDAEAAFKAYREAIPKAEGLGPVMKQLGDAYAAAGRPEDALARYREAVELLPRPLPAIAGGMVQAVAEALVSLGRSGEARKAVEAAMRDTKDPSVGQRLQAVQRRVEMCGKPFVPPPFDRWVGGEAPVSGTFKGRVVVWHLFAWWMDARSGELEDWHRLLGAGAAKGLAVVPVTHTGGWDPGERKFTPGRSAEVEVEEIGKSLRARGWTSPAAVYLGDVGFTVLLVRGMPMEVVVGRDGNVRMVQAGSESGHALALRAAALALEEPAPSPPPVAAPPGDPPAKEPPPPPAPPPGEKKGG